MTKELRAGLSFSEETTQVAVVEFRDDGADLKYIEEFSRAQDQQLHVLPETTVKALHSIGKIAKVGVSIETGNALIQVFPVESEATSVETESRIEWEWKQYIPDFSPSEYHRQNRIFRLNAESQTAYALSSVVPQSLVNGIARSLTEKKLQCSAVNLNLDMAGKIANVIHPEFRTRTVATLGISSMRMDVMVFEKAQLKAYRYGISFTPQTAVEFLANELLEFLPEVLYVYGSGVTYPWLKALKSSLGVVVPLNPFRKFRILPEVKNYSKYLGNEHRFCGCIGSILDTDQQQLKR